VSRTNVEIYTLVGEELGLIAGNETLGQDDKDKIARRERSMRSWLIEEGLCYWPDDVVPEPAALAYAKVIAGHSADLFGRGANAENPYMGVEEGYELLRRHCSQRSSREPVKSEYF
jgi:hypothetical protein